MQLVNTFEFSDNTRDEKVTASEEIKFCVVLRTVFVSWCVEKNTIALSIL